MDVRFRNRKLRELCEIRMRAEHRLGPDSAMPDPDHSRGEERYLVLGMSLHRRLLVVSHLERPPLTRLISARPATRSERMRHEQGTT